MDANLTASVEVDAPPQDVWAVVSDLRRMGKWSPQCRKVIVRGGEVKRGTNTVNINRQGWKVWPTQSTVTAYEPGRRIAFKVKENRSIWAFDLEPLDDGTRTKLTESRDVSGGTSAASQFLIRTMLGGEHRFEADLMTGMKQTLARIKSEVEA